MNRNRIVNTGKPVPSPFFPDTTSIGGSGLLRVSNSIDNLYLMNDNALEKNILEMENDPLLISHLYDWSKKLFLTPDDGYDAYSDDISEEGNNRLYRDKKLQEILKIDRQLAAVFKEVDDRQDHILDRKAKDEISVTKVQRWLINCHVIVYLLTLNIDINRGDTASSIHQIRTEDHLKY